MTTFEKHLHEKTERHYDLFDDASFHSSRISRDNWIPNSAIATKTTRNWLKTAWYCPLSYFSFQPVLHDWCNKGRGMCYPVCGMVHIKEPLLLIDKSSLRGGSGFPFSLSEWSLTICLTPYNRR